MRLTFTGPRRVSPELHPRVLAWVDDATVDGDEFSTGACVGWDALVAHHLLDTRLNASHHLVVPANRSQVDESIIERFEHLVRTGHLNVWVEYMPAGTSYRDRNARLLECGDALVAGAEYPEDDGRSRRSGSWMTTRMARAASLPIRGPLVLSELVVPA